MWRSMPAGSRGWRWWWPATVQSERLCKHKPATQQVRFVGHVDDAQLAALRAGAAIALVPSRSAETFGLAAAEAMAAGLPVVASRVGALGELLDEQSLVPAGDVGALAGAIGRLAGDRPRAHGDWSEFVRCARRSGCPAGWRRSMTLAR